MKFHVDEKWVYYVKETVTEHEVSYVLHKTQLDSYGFFNTAHGIAITDLYAESQTMNDVNNLTRLRDLLMPKTKLAYEVDQLTLF